LLILVYITSPCAATAFTWFLTALGAASVFTTKNVNQRILDDMLGFAAGIMITASFWSLLVLALDLAEVQEMVTGIPPWAPVAIGFSLGGLFIRIIDKILPHLHLELPVSNSEGPKASLPRSKYVTNT
jgi:ZIP family zinc transporter